MDRLRLFLERGVSNRYEHVNAVQHTRRFLENLHNPVYGISIVREHRLVGSERICSQSVRGTLEEKELISPTMPDPKESTTSFTILSGRVRCVQNISTCNLFRVSGARTSS